MQSLIGKRIHDIRESRNITQEYLAEKVQVSPTSISRLENGHLMVKLETICNIAQVLDVGLQDLLCDLFTYTKENLQLQEELQYCITNMSTENLRRLLAYAKMLNQETF